MHLYHAILIMVLSYVYKYDRVPFLRTCLMRGAVAHESDTNERLCARPRAKNGHQTILFPVSPMGHVILIEIFIPPYLFATVLKYPSKQLFFDAFGNWSFSYLFLRF